VHLAPVYTPIQGAFSWAFFLLLLLPKANSQPKGLDAIQSHSQKQLLPSTNLKAH
jgi:hypothetical protein